MWLLGLIKYSRIIVSTFRGGWWTSLTLLRFKKYSLTELKFFSISCMSQWGWNQHTPEPTAFPGRCGPSRWPWPGEHLFHVRSLVGQWKAWLFQGDLFEDLITDMPERPLDYIMWCHLTREIITTTPGWKRLHPYYGTSEKCRGYEVLSRGVELNDSCPYLPYPQKRLSVSNLDIKLQNCVSGKCYPPCIKWSERPQRDRNGVGRCPLYYDFLWLKHQVSFQPSPFLGVGLDTLIQRRQLFRIPWHVLPHWFCTTHKESVISRDLPQQTESFPMVLWLPWLLPCGCWRQSLRAPARGRPPSAWYLWPPTTSPATSGDAPAGPDTAACRS